MNFASFNDWLFSLKLSEKIFSRVFFSKEIDSKILFKEFEVQVPYKEVDSSINAKIAEIIPTVSLPGFRKGKAPLNIVKKKYENNVLSEVIEKLVEDKTKKLLEEKKLKPFRQPKVEIKKYEKTNLWKFQ